MNGGEEGYETLETFGWQEPSERADTPADEVRLEEPDGSGRRAGFAQALAEPGPVWDAAEPTFAGTPTPPVGADRLPTVAERYDSPAVSAAFDELARASEFERVWTSKFKRSHAVIIAVAVAVVPALAVLVIFGR